MVSKFCGGIPLVEGFASCPQYGSLPVAPACTPFFFSRFPRSRMPRKTETPMTVILLDYLRANTGRVVSREELSEAVWRMRLYPKSRTIDQTVSVLRKRLSIGQIA
jgi:hypothetical protein